MLVEKDNFQPIKITLQSWNELAALWLCLDATDNDIETLAHTVGIGGHRATELARTAKDMWRQLNMTFDLTMEKGDC